MQIQLDPNIPTNLSPEELRDFKAFLDIALEGLTVAAGGEIFTLGNKLWFGLAAIVVVITGLKIAFSGNIQPWELVKLVIGLWIPWVMLQFYTTNIPKMAYTFPGMIAAGGNWLHQLLIGDTGWAMLTGIGDLFSTLWTHFKAEWGNKDIWGLLRTGVWGVVASLLGFVVWLAIAIMLLILIGVTYAQVIWAQVALAILMILGPIFIPFLVFEPLSFLFWGWFRGMITYSLYAVIAGAVLRVFSSVGIAFITTLSNTSMTTQSVADLILWILAVVPFVIAGILASLKVGELASMLVTSAGAAGSGLLGMAASAGTMAATGGAAAAAKAGAGGIK